MIIRSDVSTLFVSVACHELANRYISLLKKNSKKKITISLLEMKYLILGILDIVDGKTPDLDFWSAHDLIGNLEFIKINFGCDILKNNKLECVRFHKYFWRYPTLYSTHIWKMFGRDKYEIIYDHEHKLCLKGGFCKICLFSDFVIQRWNSREGFELSNAGIQRQWSQYVCLILHREENSCKRFGYGQRENFPLDMFDLGYVIDE